MKRKVLATALCAGLLAITMGFVAVAKTADASLKTGRNFRTSATAADAIASSSNGNEDKQDVDVTEDVTDDAAKEVADEVNPGIADIVAETKPMAVAASSSEATHVSNEDELQRAFQKSGTIILDEDIQVTEPLSVGIGLKVIVDGAGHSIYSGENPDLQGIMWIEDNAEVTLQNITIDATGMDLQSEMEQDYYAIMACEGSRLKINNNTEIICNDEPDAIKNKWKGGIYLYGTGVMNGGEISGFHSVGITVRKTANFTLEGGTITQILIKEEEEDYGGGAINNVGTTVIKGGTLSENTVGVLNSGKLIMTGGTIKENYNGILNMSEDGTSHEQFSPIAELKGGTITGNKRYGARNCKVRGTLILDGVSITDVVEGTNSGMRLFVKSQKSDMPSPLISNEDGSTLEIKSGSIVSNAPNGIAVYNSDNSKVVMTGGTIAANGAGSVAIQTDNPNTGAVTLKSGSMKIGADSKAMKGNGSAVVSGDYNVDKKNQFTVKGISYGEGQVTPAITTADEGQTIDFTIKADTGYRISDVKVGGVSKGAVSSCTLTVSADTGKNTVEASFEKIWSGGGSSGGHSGGGGSSSGGFSSKNVTAAPSIPETPGAWIQDQTGWKFTSPNQTPYTNTWVRSKNQWYWVGADSYMKTGWNQIAEKWYYLTPVTGEMKTGWLQDGDFWYYLDGTGARKAGWLQDGPKWYYLMQDGKMAANTTTSDGYKVDGSGAWVK